MRGIALGTVLFSVLLWIFLIATSGGARTILGTELGGDFPGFYCAGKILLHHEGRLYDLRLQSRLYHELLPDEPAESQLPYAYPPIVAGVCMELAIMPYAAAYAVWSLAQIAMYAGGIGLLVGVCRSIPKRDLIMAVLLAISFEPFVIECVHGGQLSALAMLLVCSAIALDRAGYAVGSGVAIGLLGYKPTLLVVLIPVLLFSRRWRMLAGAGISMTGIALASWAAVGWHGCMDYARLMISYLHLTTGQTMLFRTWKYVDLKSFLHGCGVGPSNAATLIWAAACLGGVSMISWRWRKRPECAWPAALAGTLVLNVYVGIYDTVLIVPAMFLLAEWQAKHRGVSCRGYFRWLIAGMWGLPWISQSIAHVAGIQLYTLAIALVGMYAVALAVLNDDLANRVHQGAAPSVQAGQYERAGRSSGCSNRRAGQGTGG